MIILSFLINRLSTVFTPPYLVVLFSVCIPVGYIHQLVHGGKLYPVQFQLNVFVFDSLLKSKDGPILRDAFNGIA